MIVMKFGGTSVESAEAIERVAKIVASRRERFAAGRGQRHGQGHGPAGDHGTTGGFRRGRRQPSTISIDAGTTFFDGQRLLGAKRAASLAPKLEPHFSELENFLRGLAAVRELTPRGSDYLLSFGELLSSLIVADAFAIRGLERGLGGFARLPGHRRHAHTGNSANGGNA